MKKLKSLLKSESKIGVRVWFRTHELDPSGLEDFETVFVKSESKDTLFVGETEWGDLFGLVFREDFEDNYIIKIDSKAYQIPVFNLTDVGRMKEYLL